MNHALPQTAAVIGGKYRVDATLGEGGMGVVFAATHLETERRVALKYLQPDISELESAIERFRLEARATGRIHHPNVVDVYDFGQENGHLYLVMEFLDGCPLSARLSEEPWAIGACCRVLFPAMRGVAAAHSVGVLHRDLKPANIFLARTGDGREVVKVLDFGIAKLTSRQTTCGLTDHGVVVGTLEYMAPEQLVAAPDVDARCDVYALGVMLFRMLTGAFPHAGETPVAFALKVMRDDAPRVTELVPQLDPGLADVVSRALAREPARRFESVEAFARALEPHAEGLTFDVADAGLWQHAPALPGALSSTPLSSRSEPSPHSELRLITRPPPRTGRVALLSALAALLAIGAAAGLWALNRSDDMAASRPPALPVRPELPLDREAQKPPPSPPAEPVVVALPVPAEPASTNEVRPITELAVAPDTTVSRPSTPATATRPSHARPREVEQAEREAPSQREGGRIFRVEGVFGEDALMRPSFADPPDDEPAPAKPSVPRDDWRENALEPIAPSFGGEEGR